jgi:hypothetical protein
VAVQTWLYLNLAQSQEGGTDMASWLGWFLGFGLRTEAQISVIFAENSGCLTGGK